MAEAKAYKAPDFEEELEFEQRIQAHLKRLTKMNAEQQLQFRRKLEERIESLKSTHQKELKEQQVSAFEEGRKKGMEEAHQAVDNALKNLDHLSKKLMDSERAFLMNAEKHVVTLALAVARKIIGREIQTDTEIVYYTVKEALKQVADKAKIIIHINPADLDNITVHRADLQTLDRSLPELEFVPDDKISPGGCLIKTRTGAIDGTIPAQIEEIERNFMKKL
jgi:flagellar assembly protein FliH